MKEPNVRACLAVVVALALCGAGGCEAAEGAEGQEPALDGDGPAAGAASAGTGGYPWFPAGTGGTAGASAGSAGEAGGMPMAGAGAPGMPMAGGAPGMPMAGGAPGMPMAGAAGGAAGDGPVAGGGAGEPGPVAGDGAAGQGEPVAGNGSAGEGPVAGSGAAGDGAGAGDGGTGGDPAPSGPCTQARRLWFDDFETGDYSRWTSNGYLSGLNTGGCPESEHSTERASQGTTSHLTSISCAADSNHRVYGGMQFSGDMPLDRYTNAGAGIDAPHGIVVTYWSWLDAPGFGNGRWFSLFTANNSCDWSDHVVTLGLENASNRLTPAHIQTTGGQVEFAPGAPRFPFRQWVRTTVYLNYHTGVMHVWQDGETVVHATFTRSTRQICQFHWGLYANGANTDITLFEDDMSIWKLEETWSDFDSEPYLGHDTAVCEAG